MGKNHERVDRLAAILRDLLKEHEGPYLPSLRELARRLHADMNVVSAAARVLRDEGLLKFRQGQRMRIPDHELTVDASVLKPSSRSRVHRVVEFIRARVESGAFAAGTPLPKRQYFSRELDVSEPTVSKALGRLTHRGLVHRKGHRWIVGRSPETHAAVIGTNTPVIVIVQPTPHHWEGLRKPRTAPFARAFVDEADRHKVTLLPFSIATNPTLRTAYHAGIDRLRNTLASLGPRHIGTIIVGEASVHPDIKALVRAAESTDQPVAWYTSGEKPEDLKHPGGRVVHCHYSIGAFVRTGMEYLHAKGHREAAYVKMYVAKHAWSGFRYQMLRRSASQLHPPVAMRSIDEVCERLANTSVGKLAAELERVVENRHPTATKALCRLAGSIAETTGCKITDHVSISKTILQKVANPKSVSIRDEAALLLIFTRATVLVAANDDTCYRLLGMFHAFGVSIPDEIAVLSYDNYLDFTVIPCDVVDLGGRMLGYRTFHALYRIMPLGKGITKSIVAEPLVISRGSVRELDS